MSPYRFGLAAASAGERNSVTKGDGGNVLTSEKFTKALVSMIEASSVFSIGKEDGDEKETELLKLLISDDAMFGREEKAGTNKEDGNTLDDEHDTEEGPEMGNVGDEIELSDEDVQLENGSVKPAMDGSLIRPSFVHFA